MSELGQWIAEYAVEIVSLLVSCISAFGVFAVANAQKRQAIVEEQNKKKDIWHKEILSTEKIEEHAKEFEVILKCKTLNRQEKCEKLNAKMFEFFYNVVDYVSFFDSVKYEELKTTIMTAVDNVMFSIVYMDHDPTNEDVEKILDIYRMKLTYYFYKMDIDNQ